jgi:hypothetical protein
MSAVGSVIDIIQRLIISNSQDDELPDVLDSLNLGKLDNDLCDDFLNKLFRLCFTYNANVSLIKIYKYWETNLYPGYSEISFCTFLFLMRQLNSDILKYVLTSLAETGEHYTLIEIVMELHILSRDIEVFQNINDGIYQLACDRLVDIFGRPNISTIEYIYNETLGPNRAINVYFAMLMRKYGNFRDIPSYIINKDELLLKESDTPIPEVILPDVSEFDDTKIISVLLDKYNIDISSKTGVDVIGEDKEMVLNTFREELKEKIKVLKSEDKLKLIDDYIITQSLLKLNENVDLYQLLGPVAPVSNANVIDMEYGGDRMFISSRFTYDSENENETEENWFKGYCENCNYRIRRKYHAVRIPLQNGGWLGCFCSWYCAEQNLEEGDTIGEGLIALHEQKIEKIGIIDRVPDNEYNDYLIEYYKGLKIEGDLSILYFYQYTEGILCEGCAEFEDTINVYENKAKIVKIDVDNTDINLEELNISSVPSFIIYKGNKFITLIEGYDEDFLVKLINSI